MQLFFHLYQVALQLGEIFVGLEVGVGFLQRDQPADTLLQCGFKLAQFAWRLRGHGLSAQFGDCCQYGLFMACIGFHRSDQRRHQVMATEELYIHVGPGRTHLVTQAH